MCIIYIQINFLIIIFDIRVSLKVNVININLVNK